ncbi:Multidrug resistance protein fnx1 [Serendipita indica DSM 11827]|nr:Multidrug resistance protein fnx1 [Serendipita indica DSM 11827]
MSSSSERDPLLLPQPGVPSDEQPSPPAISNVVSRAKLVWILVALWTTVFLGAMDGTIVATLQQPIGDYFEQSHKASYVGTSYLLSICCFTPLYGRLSDILGRKGAMLLALAFFTTGTFFCAIAPSMEALIAARAIAGMGGGGVMTVSSITVTDLIPLRSRGLFQGLANMSGPVLPRVVHADDIDSLFGAGAGLGGPLGGWISDNFGWRIAFGFQVPLLVLAAILVSIHVNIVLPKAPLTIKQKLAKVDWLGSLTLVVAVSSILIGFSLKATEDLEWSDMLVWGPLALGVLGFASFGFVEAKVSPEPVLPMQLLLSRTPLAVALTNFFGSIVSFSMLYNVPLYFMAVRLQTASQAGLHLLPNSFALSIGSVGAGWIMRHTGKYWRLVVASTALSLFASIRVASWDQDKTSEFELWFDIAPNGLGFASTLTSTLIAIIACVSRDDMAIATGITYLFRTTGQVLGVSLSGTLFQAILMKQLRERMPGPDASNYLIMRNAGLVRSLKASQRQAAVDSFAIALRTVFICQAALAFIGMICALPIEERPLPGSHEEHEESHQRRQQRSA